MHDAKLLAVYSRTSQGFQISQEDVGCLQGGPAVRKTPGSSLQKSGESRSALSQVPSSGGRTQGAAVSGATYLAPGDLGGFREGFWEAGVTLRFPAGLAAWEAGTCFDEAVGDCPRGDR